MVMNEAASAPVVIRVPVCARVPCVPAPPGVFLPVRGAPRRLTFLFWSNSQALWTLLGHPRLPLSERGGGYV